MGSKHYYTHTSYKLVINCNRFPLRSIRCTSQNTETVIQTFRQPTADFISEWLTLTGMQFLTCCIRIYTSRDHIIIWLLYCIVHVCLSHSGLYHRLQFPGAILHKLLRTSILHIPYGHWPCDNIKQCSNVPLRQYLVMHCISLAIAFPFNRAHVYIAIII